MHEEVSVPELTEAIARLSALLGPRQGGVLLLEGGITNRNYRVNFGGTAYVVRLSGKDTELLGIDREAERLATRRASELELGPRVAATLDEPACLVTVFVESRGACGGAAPAGLARRDRARAARLPRVREGMWGLVQSTFSDLDYFESYADRHFERLARTSSDERFGAWLKSAR